MKQGSSSPGSSHDGVHGKFDFIRTWEIPSLLFVPLEDVSAVSKRGVVIFLSLSHKTSAGELKGGEFL